MTHDPILSLCVTVDYAGKKGVLKEMYLEQRRGEILGLVGHSGSGKSSLSLAIMGLLGIKGGRATGTITLNGRELATMSERELRHVRGREVSLVLQSPMSSLNPMLSVSRQLSEAWMAHNRRSVTECRAAVRDALTSVSLPSDEAFLKRRPAQLSVGQAQRVLIAMAIINKPDLLIADEATSALDVVTQSEILKLFRQLNAEMGMSILFISHDLLSVASLCDRVAILHDGSIVETGTPRQIFLAPQHPYTKLLTSSLPSLPAAASATKS